MSALTSSSKLHGHRTLYGPCIVCTHALHTHSVRLPLAASAGSSGFGFIRAIRLVRVARIFKISKYSVGIQMFMGAMSRSVMSLSILLVLLGLGVILVASVMSLAEGGLSDPTSESYDEALLSAIGFDASAHQVCFGTIPRCFWWALVTMTTVGYVSARRHSHLRHQH